MRKQCSCVPLTPPSHPFILRALHLSSSMPCKSLLRAHELAFSFIHSHHSLYGFCIACKEIYFASNVNCAGQAERWKEDTRGGYGRRLNSVPLWCAELIKIHVLACVSMTHSMSERRVERKDTLVGSLHRLSLLWLTVRQNQDWARCMNR